MQKTLLIDGSGFIFRAFHALPPLTRSDGTPVGAVYGFCSILIKLLSEFKDCKILVVFDKSRTTFRQEIYPLYKANRSETPEDLIPQFPLFRQACTAFGISFVEVENFEADDIIATYCQMAEEQNEQVIIVSSDKDLMQLVSDCVSMLDPIKNKFIGENEVYEKFGVKPYQVVDVQALVGDSSDNILGVAGIGIKTAGELIRTFDNLENLLSNLDNIPQKKRKQTLEENIENARISYQLAKLRKDVPVPFSITDIPKINQNFDILKEFLETQGFGSLIKRIASQSDSYKNLEKSENLYDDYHTIDNLYDLKKWCEVIKESKLCAFDCETTSLNAIQAKLVGISLATRWNGKIHSLYIPLAHQQDYKQISIDDCLNLLKPLLSDSNIKKVGHNIKYDILVLKKYEVFIENIEDSMLISYCLSAGKNGHSLDELSELYFSRKNITFKQVIGKNKTFDQVDIKDASIYACEDSQMTFQLYEKLIEEIKTQTTLQVYELIEKPLIPVIVSMEEKGIKINQNFLKDLGKIFLKKIEALNKQIYELAGEEFNIGSPKQLGDILFNKLSIGNSKKTKTGAFVTDAETLEKLAFQGVEIAQKVLEWRGLSKLNSTYVEGLIDSINPLTQRINTCFSMVGANTGRLSSSDPNLQNIPIKNSDGRQIRKAFIAENEYKIVSLDYSQIELRLLAHFADVPNLVDAFVNGQDIHKATASQIFEIPIDQVTSEQRRKAKTINFGIIYGISGFGLAQQLNISNSEASEIIKSYLKKYSGIEEYMKHCREVARKQGFVETIMKRRCYIDGINDKNFTIRNFAERRAVNAPLQGSNADIIKMSMVKIFDLLKNYKSSMILQVHDELLFEMPEDEIEILIPKIKNLMEGVITLKMPLVVDVGIGSNWDEAH